MPEKKKTHVPAKTPKASTKSPLKKVEKKGAKPAGKATPKKDNQSKVKPAAKASQTTLATTKKAAPKPVAQPSKMPEKKKPLPPSHEMSVVPKVEKDKEKKEKKGIKVGDMAPDFTLKDQFGNDVKLSALRGKKVLLSFHPLAWTPICELQMRSLELKKSEFDKMNTIPLGISVDSMYTKREWATFLELEHVQILADFWPHGEVAKKYGQFIDKNGVSGRVNILVDENGKVIWMKVYDLKQVPDIEEVLAVISEKSSA